MDTAKLERVDSKGEETWFGAVHPEDDGAASDDSQETTFSAATTAEKLNSAAASMEELRDEDVDGIEGSPLLDPARKKGRYPYGPLFFIMTATAGQRYGPTMHQYANLMSACM